MKDSLAWGLFFIGLGIVLLLFSYGIIPLSAIGDWWRIWPMIFVIIGLVLLLSKKESEIEEVKNE